MAEDFFVHSQRIAESEGPAGTIPFAKLRVDRSGEMIVVVQDPEIADKLEKLLRNLKGD